jgi:hypothetical protein
VAQKRPPIPAQLRREVIVEAGDRCAIPTCRETPVHVHHIDGDPTNNTFENLIALCPTDHERADKQLIKRAHVHMYKANLSVVSQRYGDLERRIINVFVDDPHADHVVLPTELTILMGYLVLDDIVEMRVPANEVSVERLPSYREYWLTEAGRAFVKRLGAGGAIA